MFNHLEAMTMWRSIALIALSGFGFSQAQGQGVDTSGCLPRMEFSPILVQNPGSKVSFKCFGTPLDLIKAVGFQTRIPLGLELGRDTVALLNTKHSYHLDNVDASYALLKAIEDTGYSIKDENNVVVLIASDLTPRQWHLLHLSYPGLKLADTMFSMGVTLTMWMRAESDPRQQGFGASIMKSTNDEKFSVEPSPEATTEEIANQIVARGSGGMWIFKASPSTSDDLSADSIDIEPYQHYSNRPVAQD